MANAPPTMGGEIRTSPWEPIYPRFCKCQSDHVRNSTVRGQVEYTYTSVYDPEPEPGRRRVP